jgi:hypothetical protein
VLVIAGLMVLRVKSDPGEEIIRASFRRQAKSETPAPPKGAS